MTITQEQLKSFLTYDPITGRFFRKAPRGTENDDGSIRFPESSRVKMIALLGASYTAARVAWLYVTGEIPPSGKIISFRNKDSEDFRFTNLYITDRSVLKARAVSHGKYYKKGVWRSFDRHKQKFGARFRPKGIDICLGFYTTEDEAHSVYLKAVEEYSQTGMVSVLQSDGTFKVYFQNDIAA